MVGRQAEWQALQTIWRTANRGALRFVCVQGEAGIGKTRLTEELVHWAQQQGIAALRTRAYAAEGGLAYAPLVECLRNEPLSSTIARMEAVWRSELARLLPELLAADPALAPPEPLTERWQRQRLFDALARAIVVEGHPLVLVLDDLQWCDEETLAWLRFLANHRPQARLLIVMTVRPDELVPDHPVTELMLELRRLDLLTELPLAALDATETTVLAEGVAEQPLDVPLARALFRATEGNPLFIVETMRAQLTHVGSPASPLALPPKVQAVIQARLAQLSPAARDLAALAATIGRSFTTDVLAAACEQDEDSIVRSLDELWRRGIVREQGVNGYDFSHDRLRDVAYAEIQPARRRLLHRRVAKALEQVHPDGSGAVSAQLAHHYEQTGQVEQAAHHLQRAAAGARQVYAHHESIALLERGLALLQKLPSSQGRLEQELELQMALCSAWAAVTSYLGQEAEAAYTRALELCRRIQHMPHLFTALWGLHEVALYRTEYRESVELAHQCLQIAEELGDPGLLLEAHHAAWGPYYFLGEYDKALAHMQRGLALYDRHLHEALSVDYGVHDARACALYESALAFWAMGLLDQSRHWLELAVAHGRVLSLPANIADAYGYAGLLYHLLRDPQQTQLFAQPALEISTEKGYPYTRFLGAIELGWSLALQGETAEGVALARQGMAASLEFGQRLHHSQLAAMLAEACMAAGHFAEALDVVDEGIVRFQRYRDLLCAPDLWLLKGEALSRLGVPATEVEECFTAGLALARELGARVSELRAATRLAQFQQLHGRAGAGHQILQALYSQFTAGHDNPDLRAAQALLADLSHDD